MTAAWEVVLPWPSGALSPNSRHHWRKVAAERKALRNACYALATNAGARIIAAALQRQVDEGKKIRVHCDFYPPDKRHHDDANVMYRMKAAIDGVADALGIDDRHFRTSYELLSMVAGMVRLRILED